MTDPSTPSFGLVLDCTDPEVLARFWAPALGYVDAGTFGNYVALLPPDRRGPKLLLQRVAEPKTTKNRMHLDIEVADVDGEVERLVALGAALVGDAPLSEQGMTWRVLQDPEGNEFCVCAAG